MWIESKQRQKTSELMIKVNEGRNVGINEGKTGDPCKKEELEVSWRNASNEMERQKHEKGWIVGQY